ncbi:MAG: hypothetical protein ACRDJV_00340 [Actinomycetota bacterium]
MIDLLKRGFADLITADEILDELRRHSTTASTDDLEQLAKALEQFLLTVPDALAHALAMSKDRRCGRSVAFATGTIFNYLFDEEDLLPEASFGTIGLLDDAYLVHGFVAILRQTYPSVEPSMAYAAPDDLLFGVVADLLPEGVAQSLLRTCESTVQVAQALFPAALGEGTSDSDFRPQLRVDQAVKASTGEAARAE